MYIASICDPFQVYFHKSSRLILVNLTMNAKRIVLLDAKINEHKILFVSVFNSV